MDADIYPYIDEEVGSAFIRISENEFKIDDQTEEIFMVKR